MKATLRIPTKEYAFLEIETEVNSVEEAYEAYTEAMKLVNGGEGMSTRDFNHFLDNMLIANANGIEDYTDKMSKWQQSVAQEIKKALKRIKPTTDVYLEVEED